MLSKDSEFDGGAGAGGKNFQNGRKPEAAADLLQYRYKFSAGTGTAACVILSRAAFSSYRYTLLST